MNEIAHYIEATARLKEENRILSYALSLALKGNVRDVSAAKDALIKRAGEALEAGRGS